MCFKYIGYDLGLQFFTCLNEAAIGLCGTVGCSLCPSCDHAAAPGRSQGSGFELLFNIPGWVFYVGMGVLVRRARHQIHTLVQSAFFPINKTWSSGAELLLEKGANHTKIQYYTPCRQNRYIPLEGIGFDGLEAIAIGLEVRHLSSILSSTHFRRALERRQAHELRRQQQKQRLGLDEIMENG